MSKAFKRIRAACLTLGAIEIIAIILLCLFYFLDLNGFKEIFTIDVAFIVSIFFIGINFIVLGISFTTLYYFRKKGDLTASEVIGADVKEAYNFGKIGLVVVDATNHVLWTNELLPQNNIYITNEDIIKWDENLQTLIDGAAKTVKITKNQKKFEVEFLPNVNLFIFKDITDIEDVKTVLRNNETVIGIVLIDNYKDFTGTVDDSSDVISKVRNEIVDYFKGYKCVLRRYTNDAYAVVCNNQSLEAMEKDQFSLLEKIHNLKTKETINPPTLSIAFAHGISDLIKVGEMTNDALDLALSRGGDQVIVSTYGSEVKFFGGKSQAIESKNKVKSRSQADSLISTIKDSSQVIVLGHKKADLDAIGSCLGVMGICAHLGIKCNMVYDPKLVEKKAHGAFTSLFSKEQISSMIYTPSDALNHLDNKTLVIIVDCPSLPELIDQKVVESANKVVIIDHHIKSDKNCVESPVFSIIDSSASSACELICELVRYSSQNPKIEIPQSYATYMLAGIFLDSNYYKSKTTGIRTFEASMILKEFGADNARADDFLKDEQEEYTLIVQIASTIKTYRPGIVYCKASEKDIVDEATLAKVANQCMQMKGVNAAFVFGKVNDKAVRISCRCDGSVNVSLLAEKMGGGGRFNAAAVVFQGKSIDDVEAVLISTLDEYLSKARMVSSEK